MKYGKQYLESLESVPEEWRKQAIEYRKLKKVINRVASELKDLGLTSEVLKELLENHQKASSSPPSSSSALPPTSLPTSSPPLASSGIRWAPDVQEDEKQEGETRIEEVLDEAEGVVEAPEEMEREEGEMSEKKKGKQKEGGKEGLRKRRVRATYEFAGTTAHPEPRIHLVFSSCSSESYSSSGDDSLSNSEDPSSSAQSDEDEAWDSDELAASPAKFLFSARNPRKPKRRTSRAQSSSGSKAMTPTELALERLRLQGEERTSPSSPAVSAPTSVSPSAPTSNSGSAGQEASTDANESDAPASESGEPALPNGADEIEFEGAGPHAKGLLRRMYGVGEEAAASLSSGENSTGEASAVEVRLKELVEGDDDEGDDERVGGGGGTRLSRAPSVATIRPRLSYAETGSSVPDVEQLDVQPLSLAKLEKMKVGESEGEKRRSRELREQKSTRSLKAASLRERREERAEEGDDEGEKKRTKEARPRRRHHRPRQHRREVFIPLSSDTEFLTLLTSALNSLATLQLAQKRQFTESVRILADEVSAVSSPSRPKSDLYIWREIFALWAEGAIFESSRERDRGERSTEEVEKKLEWFVDQVAKRKLAKRMRNKESRAALEKFVALNVELLDLKKFQIANEEAARKILKKHDKRTALTASYGFPRFLDSSTSSSSSSDASDPLALISSQLVSADSDRRVLTLPGFPSLPHILLSTFTTTLLPIIPALEDYECSICGDVAFKPIRLSCGHKFCVRCLVKMQKRGQDSCPQCRSQVVLRANATNLDHELQDFLVRWFPKEVKAKEKSNTKEAAKEELEEMGIVERKCVIS
ncbi:hypothetical protein JCM8547_000616 [Rhodosporidiobolus lusitaniae]